jgi:glucose-fructose oxidoreductase
MPAARKLGFAVVGLGKIAEHAVLPGFLNCRRAKLVAVVSRDAKKAKRFARNFKAPFHYSTEDFASCLKNPEISAVYIATPPGTHAEFACMAAAAGKHVLCEKPLAATTAQSLEIVEACRKYNVRLMNAYRKYFEPSTVYLKRLIEADVLGRIDMIHTSFSERFRPRISQPWLIDPKLSGGGPLADLGIYCVNSGRWLAGEDPVQVTAQSWRDPGTGKVEQGITFQMTCPSGLVIQGSSTFRPAISSFIYVQGTKGWAMLAPAFTFDEERELTVKVGGRMKTTSFPVMDEFALEIDAFAAAVLDNQPIEPDGVQGHRDMIILAAIYQAAKSQRPVAVKY